jgi:hypothetical protein
MFALAFAFSAKELQRTGVDARLHAPFVDSGGTLMKPGGSPQVGPESGTLTDCAPSPTVGIGLPVRGERSTPTDAINRPTSVHGSAGPSNSASHWGYSTHDAPLRDSYRLAVNDCISGAADRHRPGKGDENHTSGRNR